MDLSKRITSMETPKTRMEMERNSHLFMEELINRRLSLPNDFMIKYSLMKLSFAPNRRLDFLSVDEQIRLLMNMANQMQQFNEKTLADNNDTSNSS